MKERPLLSMIFDRSSHRNFQSVNIEEGSRISAEEIGPRPIRQKEFCSYRILEQVRFRFHRP